MNAFRIAVLASGTGSNLQAILDVLHEPESPEGESAGAESALARIEVVGVASDKPGALALGRATEAGVETAVFAGDRFEDRAARDLALGDWIESRQADLIVLAGYMQLLTPGFVQRFAGRVINVHPALLPAFPGLDGIGQTLAYGATVGGVTVHFVDEGVDSGPVLLQRAVPVPPDRDRATFESAIHATEHELLPEAIRLIASGRVTLGPGRSVRLSP